MAIQLFRPGKGNSSSGNGKNKKKKSVLREWVDAIVFAVVAASLIRWLFLEAFTIPTQSMENSLLRGDYLFVSKFHYGARTPFTPLQVPLTHQKIWGTQTNSYTDLIQLPFTRLPGLEDVENGDVVVFNWPPDYKNGHPIDQRTNYIKRCIGIPGDSVAVQKKQVFVNGQAMENPEEMQFAHVLLPRDGLLLQAKFFKEREIRDVQRFSGSHPHYEVQTSPAMAAQIAKIPEITQVAPLEEAKPGAFGTSRTFPENRDFGWSVNDFGPLYCPKAGDVIPINERTLALYGEAIRIFEHHDAVEIKGDKLYLDGNAVSEYTFKQGYYFMMGDNRHNSEDSRFWGFVPEDHIVGKALLVWFSHELAEPDDNLFTLPGRIRWRRLFMLID